MEDLFPLLIIGFFVVTIGGIIWLGRKQEQQRVARLEALAANRGWHLELGRDGRRKTATLTAPDGRWVLRLASGYSTGGSRSRRRQPGSTDMTLSKPSWPGQAIFIQRMPGGLEGMVGNTGGGLAGFLQNSVVKTFLRRVVPSDILDSLPNLTTFEAPAGVELTILATDNPRDLDLPAIHAMVHGWRPVHRRDLPPPMVSLGRDGLRLRLGDELTEAEDIDALISAAETLSQTLSR